MIFFRWADEQKSVGVDGCERYFRHPFLQTWAMTFGEMSCLWVYAFMFYCRKDKSSSETEVKNNWQLQ